MGRSATVQAAAKRTVKGVLDRHPHVIKNNRLYHEVERARAYRHFAARPELTDRPDLLKQLVQDGVVVVPGFLGSNEAREILSAMGDALERGRAGHLPGYVFTTQPEILCRIAPADELVGETRTFFDHPTIRSLVDAYMSPMAASYRREIDYRYGISNVAQADLYHFDNWRPLVKAFLYLVDVSEETAPFVYVPGTHKPEAWRRRHDIAYDADGTTGRFGHFFPQEYKSLQARFGWQDLVCTGSAGTLILADLRGLHRGTPLKSGHRIMLTNAFDLMSAAPNGA
jgi:hypothetical protein